MHVVRLFIDTFFRLGFEFIFVKGVFEDSQYVNFLFIITLSPLLFGEGFGPRQVFFGHYYVVELIIEIFLFKQLFGFVKSAPFYVIVEVDLSLFQRSRDLKLLLDLLY